MSGISRDLWMKALDEAGLPVESDDDSVTAAEFADMMGIDRQAATRRLKTLEKQGKATRTKKRAVDSQGRHVFWNGWKLVDSKSTPKKKR